MPAACAWPGAMWAAPCCRRRRSTTLIAPYLGGDDPIFGFCFGGELRAFFDHGKLAQLAPDPSADLNILYGCGAALAGWAGRAGLRGRAQERDPVPPAGGHGLTCLGAAGPLDPKTAYKRSYFVDWPAANRHKAGLYARIDWIVDGQRPDEIVFAAGGDLRQGLDRMANSYFRVRPWFEPGPWGGQWIRQRMPQLAQDVPNYAWSFELIVPENGLVFESDDWLLEVSFDFLMYRNPADITGDGAAAFGHEFPIRFDFLDTFDGGNLSVQCHPRPEYIRRNFGERFTQDETYYILDSGPQAPAAISAFRPTSTRRPGGRRWTRASATPRRWTSTASCSRTLHANTTSF